jgi:hypothetical protein
MAPNKSKVVASGFSNLGAAVIVFGKGGVILMRPLLLHASSTARVAGRRRVLHLEFAADDLPGNLEWFDRCCATHKHPKVKSWLKRHSRFHVHLIPTSSSWLNLVEHWFREVTDKRIRRGAFQNVKQLIAAIQDFIQHHNQDSQPFVWTAQAETILAKVARTRAILDKTHLCETLH